MTDIEALREITKEMLSGAVVTDVHETYEISEGIDLRVAYFTTDRGFTFTLPIPEESLMTCELPKNARRLGEEFLSDNTKFSSWFSRLVERKKQIMHALQIPIRSIKGRKILGIFCDDILEDLGFYDPQSVSLVFEDGSEASNTVAAMHGTGAAGLYFWNDPGHPDDIERVDFFSVPKSCE